MEIRLMIQEIRGYRLIRGFRDEPPRDEKALISALVNAARIFCDHPEYTEFDINPLILYEDGCIAVDVRFIAGEQPKPDIRKRRPLDPDILKPQSIAVIGASLIRERSGIPLPGTSSLFQDLSIRLTQSTIRSWGERRMPGSPILKIRLVWQ